MESNSFSIYDTKLSYRNNTESSAEDWLHYKFMHYGYFYRCMNLLSAEGFIVRKDPDVAKSIRNDYWIGKLGDVEFAAHKYPNGFCIEFFQNVYFENPNGGRYDFEKYKKMPYLIKMQFLKYMGKIVAFLRILEPDISDQTKHYPKLAEDWIKCRYVEDWFHEQKDTDFDIHSLDGLAAEPPSNGLDRDKKEIHNGEIKYFRGYDGYLYRGRVYHNCNNMWWVITDKYTVRNIANFELFDLMPEDFRGRKKKPAVPEEYKNRVQELSKLKDKELIAELRRRGLKVSAKYKINGHPKNVAY